MKKMWKLNNKAVSPVIATILMVAITVVLAAVLYVMVMGFGQDTQTAPTADLTADGNRLIISLSEAQDIEDGMALFVTVNGTAYHFEDGFSFSGTGYTVNYTDAGVDDKVSVGDYFTATIGSDITIQLVWSSGGTNTVLAEDTL